MSRQEHQEQTQLHGGHDDDERKKTVTRHALFVAQRAQSLNTAGGEIIDEARIARRRAAKMVAHAVEQRRQVVFAHAKFVEDFRRFRLVARVARLTSSKTGSLAFGAGADFSTWWETVSPNGVAVERNFGSIVRVSCVSSVLISASSAAI